MNEKGRIFAVTGIDTGIGKSIATGLIAKGVIEAGKSCTTCKLVQTGCSGVSEDILLHRQLMGVEVTTLDETGTSCPYVYPVPCSPHLAASLAGEEIDPARIARQVEVLAVRYEIVLAEGAGGLYVPLTRELMLIDFLEEQGWPVILVTSHRLGSLNHTLLSLEALRRRGMRLAGIVYNRYGHTDPRIAEDSLEMIASQAARMGFMSPIVELYESARYREVGTALHLACVCERTLLKSECK